MSGQLSPGYIWRIAQANTQQVQTVIATHAGAGLTFGGAAQWDFVSAHGRDNFRPISAFSAAGVVDISGDFGHAFNRTVEVRWKRCDQDVYDVLILSETARIIAGATPLEFAPGAQWRVRRAMQKIIIQPSSKPTVRSIDYRAPTGTVQFQRFVEE